MKTLLISLITLLTINSAFSMDRGWWQSEGVPQVIFDESHDVTLRVEEDTFIPNIMGYACPVPAINLNRWQSWHRELNHRGSGDFGVKTFALRIQNPNMQFCHWPNAQEIFGEDFVVGAEFKMTINTRREIVEVTDHNGKKLTILREIISASLNGKDLFSQAFVSLSPRD